jgi:RHS repeat-associated protein
MDKAALSESLSWRTFDAKGNLTSVTDALGHVTSLTSYDANGRPLTPVAVLQPSGRFYIAPDHLGAPHQITDAGGAVVWQWNPDPFGNGDPVGAFPYELRFPGQFFDQATRLHYNYFRDYDPRLGRYLEATRSAWRTGSTPTPMPAETRLAMIPGARTMKRQAAPITPAQCQANGGFYYHKAAQFVCSHFPNCSWSMCVRQGLQTEDAMYCDHSGFGCDVACVRAPAEPGLRPGFPSA